MKVRALTIPAERPRHAQAYVCGPGQTGFEAIAGRSVASVAWRGGVEVVVMEGYASSRTATSEELLDAVPQWIGFRHCLSGGVTSSLAPVISWIVAVPELVSVAGSHKLARG